MCGRRWTRWSLALAVWSGLLSVASGGLPVRQGPALGPGVFLVADRGLRDPNFRETVVLLVRFTVHGGAVGLIVNRPASIPLGEAMPGLTGPGRDRPTYLGGPVGLDKMSLLVDESSDGRAERVIEGVYFSTRRDLLRDLVAADGGTYRVHAGYSGWSPGQLENELERGDWHVISATADTVFDPHASTLWQRLIPPDPSLSAQKGDRPLFLRTPDREASN